MLRVQSTHTRADTQTHTFTHIQNMHTRRHKSHTVHIHTYTQADIQTHIHNTYKHTCTHINMHTNTFSLCMSIHTQVQARICAHTELFCSGSALNELSHFLAGPPSHLLFCLPILEHSCTSKNFFLRLDPVHVSRSPTILVHSVLKIFN